MLLDALADAYDPPLEKQDLPSISGAVNETLSEWDQRLSAIWAEWNTHPQRLRPVRQAMEERLLRSFAGLINEIIRSIPDIRLDDLRRVAEAIYADPSSLPEAMVEPFRERIAVGDYAGALGKRGAGWMGLAPC